MEGTTTLLRRLRNEDDAEAWSAFVDRYGQRIYGWCGKWGLQDADRQEVTQRVLIGVCKVMRKRELESREGITGYLHQATKNAICDVVRETQRVGQGSGDSGVLERLHNIPVDGLVQEIEKEHQKEALQLAMEQVRRKCSERDWGIFTATWVDGRPPQEVAEQYGAPIGTLYVVKRRVLLRVRNRVRQISDAVME